MSCAAFRDSFARSKRYLINVIFSSLVKLLFPLFLCFDIEGYYSLNFPEAR